MKKAPLLVHLIFHPQSEEARELARSIHRALNDDPAVPGLRVPTIFCRENASHTPPKSQDLDQAERSFVIPLADTELDVKEEWCSFVADLWEESGRSAHHCVPIQLTEHAWPLDERLRGVNFVRALAEPEESRTAFIVRRIVTELCRYLHGDQIGEISPEAPTKMFISYTKMDLKDEPKVVKRLEAYLKADQPIKIWYDSGDIPGGSLFAQKIDEGIEDSSLLCVLTNNYASREWCRKEVLLAKEKQRPIVVIDALTKQEIRSFPYLGNLPVLRWSDKPEAAIDVLLKETLRHLHTQAMLEKWKQDDEEILTRAPELVTVTNLPAGTTVLYPDPPLGTEETRTLSNTGITVTTPLERLAKVRPLQGKQIALSMSESTDIRRFGFDEIHFEGAMLELTRYLLIKGGTLVYGGHLGSEGYTEKLTEIVRSHNELEGVDPVDRIENYIGWPLPFDKTLKSKYKYVAKLRRIPRPEGVDEQLHGDFVDNPEFFPGDTSAKHRYAWARGMTAMRMAVTQDTVARLVLGGTFGATVKTQPDGERVESWYYSRIPGVLEEVMISLEKNQPIFILGAFGGVAALVIDLLEGVDRAEMTWEYQKRAPFAEDMRAIYEERGEVWWDYPEMLEFLRNKGIAGLNTLLSEEENRELFYTRDIMRMVELIVKGLDHE